MDLCLLQLCSGGLLAPSFWVRVVLLLWVPLLSQRKIYVWSSYLYVLTEPCCTMLKPLYVVSIVSFFFVEPGIGCPRFSTLSGNILRKVRRESVLPSVPVSTFAFNVWVPGLSGSLIYSSVKISVRLSLCCWTASNVNCSNYLYNLLGSLVSEFIAQIWLLHFLFWILCSCLGLCVVRAWANLFLFSFFLVHIFAQSFFFPQAEHMVPQAVYFPFWLPCVFPYRLQWLCFIVSWLSPPWISAICFIWLRDASCVRPLLKRQLYAFG